MKTLFVLAAAASLSAAALAADIPPTAYDLLEDFTSPELVAERWQPLSGTWQPSGSAYYNSGGLATELSIVRAPVEEPSAVHARIFKFGGAGRLVGVVFQFDDRLNYFEAVLEDLPEGGFVRLRQVSNGVATTLASAEAEGGSRWYGTLVDLEVARMQGRVYVWANGRLMLVSSVAAPASGQVGLVTHSISYARFESFVISRPFGDQPFNTTFGNGLSTGWSPASGNWSAVGGTYRNTEAAPTGMSQAPIVNAGFGLKNYTLRARMLNPSSGAANLVGIFFAQSAPGDYYELVFSPTGVAAIKRVVAGASQTVATATYRGQPSVWFDVNLFVRAAGDGSVDVSVDGAPVFANVSLAPQNPASLANRAGVITHSTPGTFDNFFFGYDRFTPFMERFAAALPEEWVRSGTWDTVGGTLNSISLGASDIVTMKCCDQTDFVMRARVRNHYENSGNFAGLVYNYQPAGGLGEGDHYEVLLSPTGAAYLDKIISGTRYRLLSTTYNATPEDWFTVTLVRVGRWTTIKVNDVIVFDSVYQDQLGPGAIGVISRWSQVSFDNISVTQRMDRSAPLPYGIRF